MPFAKDYKYARKGSLLPSLVSVELMFGKRDDTSDHVRLRTREDRAANTTCAPHKSHSVFRHRLVAMLCGKVKRSESPRIERFRQAWSVFLTRYILRRSKRLAPHDTSYNTQPTCQAVGDARLMPAVLYESISKDRPLRDLQYFSEKQTLSSA